MRIQLRRILVRDPDLLGIAEMADQRRKEIDQDLEKVFENVKPILNRESRPVPVIEGHELPAALKARIAAMPDPEQRIRTIVEFKLSSEKDGRTCLQGGLPNPANGNLTVRRPD